MTFDMTQYVDASVFLGRRDEAITKPQFLAQRCRLRFRSDKRIGAAIDDKSVTTFRDDVASKTRLGFDERDGQTITFGRRKKAIRDSQARDASTDDGDVTTHDAFLPLYS